MKFLRVLGVIIVVIVVIILIVGFILPKNVKITKTLFIDAQPEVVFKQVNNVMNWEKWSPFYEADPQMKITYAGPSEGIGAEYSWKSKKLGDGSLRITQSIPYNVILTEIHFDNSGSANGEWHFDRIDNGTNVTWTTYINDLGYPIGRIVGQFMDNMMKPLLVKGLEGLKAVSERTPMISPITKVNIDSFHALIIEDSAMVQNLSAKFSVDFSEIAEYIKKNKLNISGSPFTQYLSIDSKNYKFKAGIPISGKIKGSGRIKYEKIKGGNFVEAIHYGGYSTLPNTYKRLYDYILDNKLTSKKVSLEFYTTDPTSVPDTIKWETRVLIPIM